MRYRYGKMVIGVSGSIYGVYKYIHYKHHNRMFHTHSQHDNWFISDMKGMWMYGINVLLRPSLFYQYDYSMQVWLLSQFSDLRMNDDTVCDHIRAYDVADSIAVLATLNSSGNHRMLCVGVEEELVIVLDRLCSRCECAEEIVSVGGWPLVLSMIAKYAPIDSQLLHSKMSTIQGLSYMQSTIEIEQSIDGEIPMSVIPSIYICTMMSKKSRSTSTIEMKR